jgi:glycosyltransferase involved in cell wall biosynthesis
MAYSGTSKQVLLLATGLPRPRFQVCVAIGSRTRRFGEPPLNGELRAWGVEVVELGWGRLRRMRQLIDAFRPDVIHAWHLASLRFLAAASALRAGRLIASAAAPHQRIRSFWHSLDRWLLHATDTVVAAESAEAQRYRQHKIDERKIAQVPPAVAFPNVTGTREQLCRRLGIEPEARLVLCVGPLVPEKGFHDAIWAFEILRFLYEPLHLLLVGSGPDRARLERFAGTIGAKRAVHFLGEQPDVATLIAHADVVWVPSRRSSGVNVALEAMAAGRPIVASRLPALADIVLDGETGFLIDPGDPPALARQTRKLFDDPQRGSLMGEAARQRVGDKFTVAHLVDRFACLYENREQA